MSPHVQKPTIFLLKYISSNYLLHIYIYIYSQTCIKGSPLGQRKSGFKRGLIHMQFSISMTGIFQVSIDISIFIQVFIYRNLAAKAAKS
jgi:hypothetical protein